MGIDIICENNNIFTAVQCKYKKHTGHKKYNVLSWKVLSTFYALCLKTGPFEKYIVMTNCNYVRHAVKQNEKDLSICLKPSQSEIEKVFFCANIGRDINYIYFTTIITKKCVHFSLIFY